MPITNINSMRVKLRRRSGLRYVIFGLSGRNSDAPHGNRLFSDTVALEIDGYPRLEWFGSQDLKLHRANDEAAGLDNDLGCLLRTEATIPSSAGANAENPKRSAPWIAKAQLQHVGTKRLFAEVELGWFNEHSVPGRRLFLGSGEPNAPPNNQTE
jgi:hypothetical protein